MRRFTTVLVAASLAIGTLAAQPAGPQRRPLEARGKPFVGDVVRPPTWALRSKPAPDGAGLVEYDPLPRILVADRSKGLLTLTWVGRDGTEKRIAFERPDVVRAVATADVVRRPDGRFDYRNRLESLRTSGQNLTGFSIQTLEDESPAWSVGPDIFVGRLTAPYFKEGVWWRFAVLPEGRPVVPGAEWTLVLTSALPPGLVQCAVNGGYQGMKGVGEEAPEELFDILPKYESWPAGVTVGPYRYRKGITAPERVRLLEQWLPEFSRAGWWGVGIRSQYEQMIKRADFAAILNFSEVNHKRGLVSGEVVAIVRALASI